MHYSITLEHRMVFVLQRIPQFRGHYIRTLQYYTGTQNGVLNNYM